jgi:hydrogenase nickel incorporation protein HypA/HybF
VHELSVCQAIADTVTERAAGRPVDHVRVRIGALRQVVPDALAMCWEILTDATELEEASLEIEEVPAVIGCTRCGQNTTLDLPIFVCSVCGSDDVAILSGEEFLLVDFSRAEVH